MAQIQHYGESDSMDGALARVKLAPVATALALLIHYFAHYLFGVPLWTETIGEWIMAHTPNAWSVWILGTLGAWAKPFALTGGLAALGFAVSVSAIAPPLLLVAALLYGYWFEYSSVVGQISFWLPAFVLLLQPPPLRGRRRFFEAAMGGTTVAVALESYLREASLARRASKPVRIADFKPPPETFAPGLVRKAVTPTGEFYTMSKNSIDPVIDPSEWRLRLTVDGKPIAALRYQELLAAPRIERYVTLRCISNTLQSDLMGTALWSGFSLRQIADRAKLPAGILEVAFLGVDGHGDSLPLDYAFSEAVLLAIGMNGETLNRAHGFPLRLLAPRYYGFKNVKWLGEIAFVSQPYFGTWPKMGYTKEAITKTASHIDRIHRGENALRVGGVSFAGERGIEEVQVRTRGSWVDVKLEAPLSPYTWTRWTAEVEPGLAVEARAKDGAGEWQATQESTLFPAGVGGPTLRKVPQ